MGSSRVAFSADDLRVVIGLCELDHKLTDLIGPRMSLENMIQHRYRVSKIASKANILLMEIQAQEIAAMQIPPTDAPAEAPAEGEPTNGARV